jgi:O-antigen/teichoic acid export membrane protein
MGIESKFAKGVSWLAIFKIASQTFSWIVTIIVARLLMPEDYGLMAIATILTGYAEVFNELGLGAAIIQRQQIKKDDLSSVFWFSMMVALFFALLCFVAAPLTAWIFNEPRVLPLTQAVSVIFLLSGLQIVPLNLLKRDLNFKIVGFNEMVGTAISCIGMLLLASNGAGVWALLGGRIINSFTRTSLLYYQAAWLPTFHFRFNEAASYIRFGILVAVSQSFYYLFEKSDKFFAGRIWSSQLVGYYSFAQQLALIPTEKIVSLINQVSFSAFSQLQADPKSFNNFYLKIVEFTATIVLPLYVGGFLVAEDLIMFFLGEKWIPIVFLFKYLCLAQILRSINAINNFVHISRGEPKLGLYNNIILTISMAVSFYFAVQHGLNAIVIPWLATYSIVSIFWIFFTTKRINVSLADYIMRLIHPTIGTAIMFIAILLFREFLFSAYEISDVRFIALISSVVLGGLAYILYFIIFNRKVISMIKYLKKG